MDGAENEIAGAVPEQLTAEESAAQRAFRTDLNHKLRTPLNAIIGFAELLALQPGSKPREDDVQQILKSAREMLTIIEADLADPAAREAEAARPPALTCDVLYVEDDFVNFTLVERILEFRPGLRVMHASHGRLGVKLAEACKPKLILLDLNLPDVHGSEVFRLLQQNPATVEIPVVILSADATPSQIERLLKAGAKNYLTKPFDLDPFLTVVDEFVYVPGR